YDMSKEGEQTVTVSYDPQTQGDIPEYVETFRVHARVPEDWTEAGLWAWSAPDGRNAFDAWPGKAMKPDANGWYTASAPVWINSIIVNGNGGAVQTEDISIDPADIWVTVLADGTVDFTYNDPDAPVAEDITVYVKAPSDWSEPCLWAWSAPDGTNAFASWPGEALTDAGDGWMSLKVPGCINSVIVNGNGGSVQTQDLSVETGRDVWVVVTDPENAQVTYEKPEDVSGEDQSSDVKDKESSEEESSQENEESASQEPDASKDPAVSKDTDGSKKSNVPLIAGIVILAAAVLGVGGFVWHKKKK
ncbi:MAG: starch-binding protein, partial [Acetatifactor sp.]|nr:starch-binding protein [Acetatifactor sp.]